jgi:TolB-like protein
MMGEETPSQPPMAAGPVFLSYASQDADAACRICDALRAAGIEVWFDQSALRGGDVWDQKIRREIHECALFIPVISANTASRHEGYFRLEWDLADQRSHMMARSHVFVVPVSLDTTSEAAADVPDSFKRVQWTRLSGGNTPPAFVERIKRLLSPEPSTTRWPITSAASSGRAIREEPLGASWRLKSASLAVFVVLAAALAFLIADKFWLSKPALSTTLRSGTQSPAVPQESVAVLPFADMSEKKDQEYFADGLCEELIDMLSKVQGLMVTARTSSFYFKGRPEDIPTIARKLMVTHVLEGSVRKSGSHLRVTAQLVRADTGYHIWSETYDREIDDIFKVQDDIAGSVVKALQPSILTPAISRTAPTSNSEAHTLYLHALSLSRAQTSAASIQAYKDLRRAVALDPNFALAWSAMAKLLTDDTALWQEVFGDSEYGGLRNQLRHTAFDAAAHALQLDPKLAQGHLAKGLVLYWWDWNWQAADSELKQARTLDPASAEITEAAAALANTMGRFKEGVQLASLAVSQDPLGTAYWDIGAAKHRLGDLDGAAAAYQHLTELYPTATAAHYRYATVLLSQQNAQAALNEMERENAPYYRQAGMPLVLDALGRRSEADRELIAVSEKYVGMAYQISYVYAERNDHTKAIEWLERAYQLRDTGLVSVKNDPMLKNLQHDARFVSLLRKMNLPE